MGKTGQICRFGCFAVVEVRVKVTPGTLKGLFVPESVCGEVALAPTSGFQFDESPTRWIKGAHEGNAHAQYH